MSNVLPFVLTNKDPEISNLEYQKMKFIIERVCTVLRSKHLVDSDVYVAIMSLLDTPFYVRKGRKGMADPIYAVNVVFRKESMPLETSKLGDFHWGYSYTYWLSADCEDPTLISHRKYRIYLAQEAEREAAREQRLKELLEEKSRQAALNKLYAKYGAKPKGDKKNG